MEVDLLLKVVRCIVFVISVFGFGRVCAEETPRVNAKLIVFVGNDQIPIFTRKLQILSSAKSLDGYIFKCELRDIEKSKTLLLELMENAHVSEKIDRLIWFFRGGEGGVKSYGFNELPDVGVLDSLLNAEQGTPFPQQVYRHQSLNPENLKMQLYALSRASKRLNALHGRLPDLFLSDLSAEEDELLWGDYRRDLQQLFAHCDWALTSGIDELASTVFPDSDIERHSLLMKTFYRKLHANLLMLFEDVPVTPIVEVSLRLNRVLGLPYDDLCDRLDRKDNADGGELGFNVEYFPIAMAISRQIHKNHDWPGMERLLTWVWGRAYQDMGRLLASAKPIDPKKSMVELRASFLDEMWKVFLSPLMESMIRCGHESKLPALVATLNPNWGIYSQEHFRVLTKRLGRIDIHAPVLAVRPLGKVKAGATRAKEIFDWGELALYLGEGINQQPESILSCFNQKGLDLVDGRFIQGVSEQLGWGKNSKSWALVQRDGNILAQGDRLNSPEELWQKFKEAGFHSLRETWFRRYKANEAGLDDLVNLANSYGKQAEALEAQRLKGAGDVELEKECWENYLSVVNTIFSNPVGVWSKVLARLHWHHLRRGIDRPRLSQKDEYLYEIRDGVKSLCRDHLKKLEDSLRRVPSEDWRWRLWGLMSNVLNKPVESFLNVLEPTPLDAPDPLWPSSVAISSRVELLQREGRWEELETLLMPRWERMLHMRNQSKNNNHKTMPLWSWSYTFALLESMLRMKDVARADDILNNWIANGGVLGQKFQIQDLAERLGHKKWYDAWEAKF